MRERKLQKLKTGRGGRPRSSARDRQRSQRNSSNQPRSTPSTSDIPAGERRALQKRPNRIQLWQPTAESTLVGMKTPIPPDLRPGPLTGLPIRLLGSEVGHD